MQIVALDGKIVVQRHLVAVIVLPVVCCMTIIAFGAVAITNLEFTYALGISDNMYPFAITAQYRSAYRLWWTGPIIAATWAFILVSRKRCSLMTLICYIQLALVFVTAWAVFSVFAFYLSNQSFWGWRRVIVGHEVFADTDFRPGESPLVPGADRLLPGELYDSEWGTPGANSVLRNMVGITTMNEGTGGSPTCTTFASPARSQGIGDQGQSGGDEAGQDAERKDEGAE